MFTTPLWIAALVIAIVIGMLGRIRAFRRLDVGSVSQSWLVTKRLQDAEQLEPQPGS
jgi:hypothetical protein